MNTYYKNQKDIGVALNYIIDSYWEKKISEQEMIDKVNSILENNREKIISNDKYTAVIMQRCGKRRLELMDKIRGSVD